MDIQVTIKNFDEDFFKKMSDHITSFAASRNNFVKGLPTELEIDSEKFDNQSDRNEVLIRLILAIYSIYLGDKDLQSPTNSELN